jgi:hypothetical protein
VSLLAYPSDDADISEALRRRHHNADESRNAYIGSAT